MAENTFQFGWGAGPTNNHREAILSANPKHVPEACPLPCWKIIIIIITVYMPSVLGKLLLI